MSSYITLIIFALVIVGLLSFSARSRRRQAAAQAERAESIDVGTEVMTTSGLYGTVTARHEDDSVQLLIAPGVEVRWAMAALREVASLPPEYRGPGDPVPGSAADRPGLGVRMDKSTRIEQPRDAGPAGSVAGATG